jgi:hypothetical protein
LFRGGIDRKIDIRQWHPLALAAVPEPQLPPGPVNQDSPHCLGRDAKEMLAVREVMVAHQAQIRLMHQRRRIEGLSRVFLSQLCCRQGPQFVVHQRQQFLRSRWIAGLNLRQDAGDIGHADNCGPAKARIQLMRRFDNWDQTRSCFCQSVTAMIRRAFRPRLVGPKDRDLLGRLLHHWLPSST